MAPKDLIKSFDLFSTPFSFLVGDVKQKRTLIGGTISLSILAVSIIYFSYLLNLYFSNHIQAKVTSNSSIENNYRSILIKENFLIFEISINGAPLKKIEQEIGKKLLNFKISYIIEAQDNQEADFDPIECTDPNFAGFMCMNESDIMNKDIFTRPIKKELSFYGLSIISCDPSIYNNCATDQEIQEHIFNQSTYLTVFIKTQQYNPQTLQYEIGYKQEYYNFDSGLYITSVISFTKATTNVSKGLIIQSTEVKDTIYDYKRIDKLKSLEFKQIHGFSDFIWIIFQIDQINTQIFVQHPMITEVLAQFMSIFNCLMITGVIGRMIAESQIIDDMNNMLLREYYKKTSAALIAKKEGIIQEKNNKFQVGVTSKSIIDLQAKINEIDFSSSKQQFFKMTCYDRFKIFISQLFGMKKFKNKDMNSESKNYGVIYQKLLKETEKGINLFQLYKDIIQIKMAIKLILTKEQFVALKFCGSQISQDLSDHENLREDAQNQNQDEFKAFNEQIKIKGASQEVQLIFQQNENDSLKEEEQGKNYQKQDNELDSEQQINLKKDSQSNLRNQTSDKMGKIFAHLPQNERNLEIEMNVSPSPNIQKMNQSRDKQCGESSISSLQIDLLQDIDSIEESDEKQAFFLDKFLQNNLSKRGKVKSNLLDMKILANLLVSDFQEIQDEEKERNRNNK